MKEEIEMHSALMQKYREIIYNKINELKSNPNYSTLQPSERSAFFVEEIFKTIGKQLKITPEKAMEIFLFDSLLYQYRLQKYILEKIKENMK